MVRRRLTETANHFGGVLATARWQGRIKQLEKPSSSQGEISGAGPTYNRRHREKEGRREGGGRARKSDEAAVMAVEQRGPAVGSDSNKKEGKGEMTKTPISLQDLRKSLYVKAKAEPTWRFWGLYVHVCKMETLQEAYQMAKSNDGAPGIDGVTFEAIEGSGVESFLKQIQDELVPHRYQAMQVRKKEIPKDGGTKVRVLSIPAIRDRVVQGALKLILEPIFEADFQSGSYGYRPKRTAQAAVLQVDKAIMQGKTRVIDLDLRAYFDNVQHYLLLEKVALRIQDAMVMRLLNLILKSTGKKGVPQGGVITPLTQKVIWAFWLRALVLGRTRGDRDAVTNGDGVVPHENVFNHEAYDSLAFGHIKRFSSTAQTSEECCEGLDQAQECSPVVGLVGDRLQLSTKRLFAPAQPRHALSQLFDRQESFLVGGEQSFDAFANMDQFPLQTLLMFFGGIRGARCCQPSIKFLLYQSRLFQQSDHLGPDDLIQEILSDETAVVAY